MAGRFSSSILQHIIDFYNIASLHLLMHEHLKEVERLLWWRLAKTLIEILDFSRLCLFFWKTEEKKENKEENILYCLVWKKIFSYRVNIRKKKKTDFDLFFLYFLNPLLFLFLSTILLQTEHSRRDYISSLRFEINSRRPQPSQRPSQNITLKTLSDLMDQVSLSLCHAWLGLGVTSP